MSREIDALIEQHFFDCELRFIAPGDGWLVPEYNQWYKVNHLPLGGLQFIPPRLYSTDIAAAWEVIDKSSDFDLTKETNGYIEIHGEDSKYYAELLIDGELGIAHGKTMPLAICLASLKAKGVEVGE